MKYTLQCKICGTYFDTTKSYAKYCPECRKDSRKAREYLDLAIAINKQKTGYWNDPVQLKCKVCGKAVKIGPRSAVNKAIYCSDTCKLIAEKRTAEAKTKPIKLSTCPKCGKEFENPNGNKYCSDECRKLGMVKRERFIGDITLKCKVCGKNFVIHKDKYVYKEDLPKCCSPECRLKAAQKGGKTGAMKAKSSGIHKPVKKEKFLTDKDIAQNGLCAYCKTPYKDCERMQTDFRIIPEGALFDNNGKIKECPKYTRI